MSCAAARSSSTAYLEMPYGSSGRGCHLLGHRCLLGSVHRDRRGKDKALDLVQNRLVDQQHARLKVRAVVVGADEVRESLGRVRGGVVDEVIPQRLPQRLHEVGIADVALDPSRISRDVVAESTRERVGGHHLHPQPQALVGHMGADEAGRPSDQDARHGKTPCVILGSAGATAASSTPAASRKTRSHCGATAATE